jgi:tetratricopeptide (TPR) repeat protein
MAYFHSPLYAWFLAVVFQLFGYAYTLVRVFQAVLNGATCWILYALGERLFSRRTAVLAAFGWALYGPVLFYTSEILSVAWILFLNTLALFLIVRASDRPAPLSWLAAGAVMGCAVIARADILPFAGAAAAVTALQGLRAPERRADWRPALLFALGVAGPLLVVGVRNYRVSERFVMLPVNSGINFYMGNNRDYRNTIAIRPGMPYEALRHMPRRDGVIADPREPGQSAYFYAKAFEYIRSEPRDYLGCLAYKARTLVGGYELPETFDLYSYRSFSPILAALAWRVGSFGFPFGLLLPLAALGIWTARARLWELRFLILMLACLLIPLLGYWNSSRYRISLVPGLLLLAAGAVVWLRDAFREGRPRPALAPLGAVGVLTVLCAWPYDHFSLRYPFLAEMYGFVGLKVARQGDLQRALPLLQRSVAIYPRIAETQDGLGNTLSDLGRPEEGAPHLQEAVRLQPDYATAWNNLGIVFAKRGDLAEAIRHFSKALSLDPDLAHARRNLDQAQALQAKAPSNQAGPEDGP